MTSPSSGVKPIEVSTESPFDDRTRRAAVAEVQRDQVACRRASRRSACGSGTPRSGATCRGSRSVARGAVGTASTAARRGRPARECLVERRVEHGGLRHVRAEHLPDGRMPFRLCGLCSGARSIVSSICAAPRRRCSTDRLNSSPPCTTRCPTASMSRNPATPAGPSSLPIQRSAVSTAERGSRTGAVVRRAGRPITSSVSSASPPIRSITPPARRSSPSCAIRSVSVRISWNFNVDEPALSTSTFMARSRANG
jgi:hypothetical protein